MVPPRKRVRQDGTDESDEEVLQPTSPGDITVAIFCALVEESAAVRYTLDEEFTCKASGKQSYVYTYGRISEHKVVIAEPVEMGTVNAAHCAAYVSHQFPNVRLALMVGIGAGIPSKQLDIRLGDVAISVPRDDQPGVVQYDYGKYENGGFTRKGTLNKPPRVLLSAIRSLEGDELRGGSPIRKVLRHIIKQNDMFRRPDSEDILFSDTFPHVQKGQDCSACLTSGDQEIVRRHTRSLPTQPFTHRGLILSGSGVVKNPEDREQLTRGYQSAICFEMEAAGIMDELPCLVIRGISDYADTHKHDEWRCYAAATAAAYCKAVLQKVPGGDVEEIPLMRAIIDES
ncbi:nucleoside phosphorylase domain-containing protein [Microdochium trichocladiopsis]|uniref:Nucleoside phosphorylase domain-containing protein n=1 Tax=Microdochium trichocladiopsis TaxID=1682393 RepID=A0A9P8XT30_9PEZI|nr:nucleoside phosphorylase domain-containing protein [Microdochium trichocladiopsis]KAH7016245.1 nucleoside phosphorylase domain-containing protein [Microdochium trichocladiopsis]